MKPSAFTVLFVGLGLLGFVAGRNLGPTTEPRKEAPAAASPGGAPFRQDKATPDLLLTPAAHNLTAALQLQHPLARTAEVAASIQRMNAREVEEAITELLGASPSEEGDRAMTLLWQRFGELTGRYAVEKAMEHPQHLSRFGSRALSGWAMREPVAVWEWGIQQQASGASTPLATPEAMLASTALHTALNAAVRAGRLEWAQARLFETEDPAVQQLAATQLGSAFANYHPEALLALSDQVSDGRVRTSLLSGFATALAEEDPREAAAWALSVDAAEQSQILRSVLLRWRMSEGPAAVTNWLVSQPEGVATDNALRTVFSNTASNGIEEVRALLQAVPVTRRDPALAGAAMRLTEPFPAEAFSYAEQIQAPSDRQMLLRFTYNSWRGTDATAAETYINTSPHLTSEERTSLLQPGQAPAAR